MRLSLKVGKAEQKEKRSARSRLVEQFFLKYKITNCPISQDIRTRFARYLHSTGLV